MSGSIFSRLFHYRERENLSPRENYLTEMLAWMIDSLPQFGHDYVEFLMTKCNVKVTLDTSYPMKVSARTQVHVKSFYIDMVVETDHNLGFICEHKVDSELRDHQIQDYSECKDVINENISDFRTVLLTKNKDQHKQDANISIIWHEIYEYFSEKYNKEKYDCKAEEKIIIEQFLMYLTEEGMGMKETINANAVAYYCDTMRTYSVAMTLEMVLKRVFNDIGFDEEWWKKKCPGIESFLTDFGPCSSNEDYRNGIGRIGIRRFGIEFTSNWTPGLFAGVQMYNDDNSLTDFNDKPHLVVILDCKEGEKRNYQYELENIESISKIGFNIQKESKNPWRLLILKMPLEDVLSNVENNYQSQKEAIQKIIINGINWILNHYKDIKNSEM